MWRLTLINLTPSGFQSFLRGGDYDGGGENMSDADWHSFYFPAHDGETPCGGGDSGIHINCLPEEVLVKIFSNLPAREVSRSVLPVCRYWHKLGNDAVLWKRLEFSYRSEVSFHNMMKTVSSRYEHMRSITLKNFRSDQQMEQMLRHIGNNCSRLQEVRSL